MKKIDLEECKNKVLNMDCLEFMKQVPDDYFDLVLTDPPFGMSFQSSRRAKKHKKIANDNTLDWLPSFSKELKRITKKESHLYIFCSWHFIDKFKQELKEVGFNIKNILIWHKNNHGSGDLFGDYAPQYEMCIYISNGERKLNGGRSSNILKATKTDNSLHPTQKPSDLVEFLLNKSLIHNSKVFDPFMGSGTTALACKSLGLDFWGTELEKDYCEIIEKRLSQVQGSLF